ncbi:hypothetical protein CesoFtcFv8_020470 [Champsocephalus esox]|uniref:Uncharacterized protein n=1 Tax=Champsocephalus esox TaxID=159716 RepID=A0AAN8BAV1_9TELE|nr:hypothetical protein CesoFtcFv8_020470 [Champsocephalus esox]
MKNSKRGLISTRTSNRLEGKAGPRVLRGSQRACPHTPSTWSKGIRIPQRDYRSSPPSSTCITKVAVFGGWRAWPEQDDAGDAGEKMPGRPG